jgi:hypothetical protein
MTFLAFLPLPFLVVLPLAHIVRATRPRLRTSRRCCVALLGEMVLHVLLKTSPDLGGSIKAIRTILMQHWWDTRNAL